MKVKFVVRAMVNDAIDTLEIEHPEGVTQEEIEAALNEQLLDHIGNNVDAYWEIVEGDDE